MYKTIVGVCGFKILITIKPQLVIMVSKISLKPQSWTVVLKIFSQFSLELQLVTMVSKISFKSHPVTIFNSWYYNLKFIFKIFFSTMVSNYGFKIYIYIYILNLKPQVVIVV